MYEVVFEGGRFIGQETRIRHGFRTAQEAEDWAKANVWGTVWSPNSNDCFATPWKVRLASAPAVLAE